MKSGRHTSSRPSCEHEGTNQGEASTCQGIPRIVSKPPEVRGRTIEQTHHNSQKEGTL